MKNVSILNGHNFGLEKRTEIQKKQFGVQSVNFLNL